MSKKRPFVIGQEHKAWAFVKWLKPDRAKAGRVIRQANDWVEAYPTAYVAWKAKQRLGVE